jgi:hypothetical protein
VRLWLGGEQPAGGGGRALWRVPARGQAARDVARPVPVWPRAGNTEA